LTIEIHLKSIIPAALVPLLPLVLRPPIISTPPSAITLSHPLSPILTDASSKPLSPTERKSAAEEAEKRKLKWKTSILTRPFQELGWGTGIIWDGMRRVITREGFAKVRVEGKGSYKLDVTGGWTLVEGGKASLDRICRFRKV